MDKCSPLAEATFKRLGTCYDEDGTRRLAEAWNARGRGRQIASAASRPAAALRKELRARLASACPVKKDEDVCWAEQLGATKDPAVAKALRPKKPAAWNAKPNAWLSNFDIEAVMRQYNTTASFKFEFLGVVAVDFAETCYTPALCELRLASLVAKGKVAAGFILNLDRHDEPGSHWTSAFAVLDPALPSYGGYYYDSTATAWPAPVHRHLKRWQAQMQALHPGRPFPLRYNRVRHQFRNTECGMFAMFHQILWVERLRQDRERQKAAAKKAPRVANAKVQQLVDADRPTTFDLIINIPLKDDNAHKLRDYLYRETAGRGAASGSL